VVGDRDAKMNFTKTHFHTVDDASLKPFKETGGEPLWSHADRKMLANRARRLTLVLGRRPLPIAARPCVNHLLAHRWPNSGRSSSSVATSAAAPPLPIAVVAQQQVDRLMITEAAAKVRREATPDAMAPPSALDILRRPLSQRILHLNSSKGQQRLLRLSVEPGGCSGFSYKFNMAEAATVDAEEDV
jgi:hypothetical protein